MAFVKTEVQGAVEIITIDRPKALNALNPEVLADLKAAFEAVDQETVRCIVLTGEGDKSFVAGADIGSMSTMTKAEGEAFGKLGNDVFLMIERFPIAVNAGLSWAVYLLVNGFAGDFAANMVSAMFCSLVAALMARRLRVPTVVLQMPATVPMVPGGSLYYTIYYVFAGNMPTAKSYFFFTARAVFGMAIGFAVVSVLFKTIDARKTAR